MIEDLAGNRVVHTITTYGFQRSTTQEKQDVSYSFVAKGSTKREVLARVATKMDEVVAQQPIHAADREPALAAAVAFVNLIPDDEEKDVSVSVSGSIGWTGTYPNSYTVTNAQVSVYASLVTREAKVAA